MTRPGSNCAVKQPKRPPLLLTIVVPAYNEAERLGRTLPQILAWLATFSGGGRILVVDDGSTDATGDAVRAQMPAHPNLDLITLSRQSGKGAAVRAGLLAASTEIVGFMDADLSTDLQHVPEAVTAINDGADIVIGSRALGRSQTVLRQPVYRRAGARVFRELARQVGGLPDTPDSQCGFKFYRGPVAHDLFGASVINRWMFDLEILRLARHRNYTVHQLPVEWTNDPDSRLRLTLDTLRMTRDLARIRWRFLTGRYGPRGRPA